MASKTFTKELTEQLHAPFDVKDIKWKPQIVDYNNKTALAAAHADPRAYIDRFNEVVGPENWGSKFTFLTTPYTKYIKEKKGYNGAEGTPASIETGSKIVCVCELTVLGVVHSSTGDENCSDENAAANAEAQAFKRAAMTFGPGRYLYSLPMASFPIDLKTRKFIQTPTLPDWAMPIHKCEDCTEPIEVGMHKGMTIPIARLIENSQKKYQKNLCQPCQMKRAESPAQARGIVDTHST